MSKKNRNRHAISVRPATEVEIEFKVTLKEVHSRTGTQCDERRETFSFTLEHDFEIAAAWLRTDDAETVFNELCGEIGHYLAMDSRDGR